jgi:fumarate reductase subunit C
MSRGRPYVRQVEPRWWARPPYLTYTLREVTGIAVAGYALILLTGLIALARGQTHYVAWLNFLKSPWSFALHIVLLIGMIAHVWTWFRIMPKTMPRLSIGGRIVPQNFLSVAGLALATVTFIAILLLAEWMQP